MVALTSQSSAWLRGLPIVTRSSLMLMEPSPRSHADFCRRAEIVLEGPHTKMSRPCLPGWGHIWILRYSRGEKFPSNARKIPPFPNTRLGIPWGMERLFLGLKT